MNYTYDRTAAELKLAVGSDNESFLDALNFKCWRVAMLATAKHQEVTRPHRDDSYGMAGAHAEARVWGKHYAMDVYWAGKRGYVAVVFMDDAATQGDLMFTADDAPRSIAKRAYALVLKLGKTAARDQV